MKVSVLIPYFQGRRALLERTLWLLASQTYDDYDVWVLDDGSDEAVSDLCGGRIIYDRVRGPGAHPRASNMAWNHGYERCAGGFIILAHPEYMPPLDGIERLVGQYDGGARLEPTAFALSPATTTALNRLPWQTDLDALQDTPGFWTFKTPWGWTNFEAREWHHHFAFTGQTREAWDVLDFLPKTEDRGMNDSWIVGLEVAMKRPPRGVDFAVYHQHHERTTEWPFSKRAVRVERIAAGVN